MKKLCVLSSISLLILLSSCGTLAKSNTNASVSQNELKEEQEAFDNRPTFTATIGELDREFKASTVYSQFEMDKEGQYISKDKLFTLGFRGPRPNLDEKADLIYLQVDTSKSSEYEKKLEELLLIVYSALDEEFNSSLYHSIIAGNEETTIRFSENSSLTAYIEPTIQLTISAV